MREFYGMFNVFFYTMDMLTSGEEGENLSNYGKTNKKGKRSSKDNR